MLITPVIKKRAERTLAAMLDTSVKIIAKIQGEYDTVRGVNSYSHKTVWTGMCSFQPYHEKFKGNPSEDSGTATVKSDARAYIPFEALSNVKTNELVFVLNGTEYTPDIAPVDVGNLHVYWQVEITGTKGV